MEQFKYGPLLYNTSESDSDSGNFYWNGLAPVGYDALGIPIDSKGLQCLDALQCPIHPSYIVPASNLEHNEFLEVDIPMISSFRTWFDDQFMEITDRALALFVLRWIDSQNELDLCSQALYSKCATMDLEEIIDIIWPSLKAD